MSRIVAIAFGFVILAVVVGSRFAPYLILAVKEVRVARALFFAAVLFAFTLAYLADLVGSAVIIGSFAAGLVLARSDKERRIQREVHDVAQFFIPIFFVVVGAAIDIRTLNPFDAETRGYLLIGLALTAIGIVGKVLSGYAALRPGLRRFVIGIGMIPRGEVGLIFAQIGLTTGLLSAGLYSAVALMVMITTLVTPPILRRLLVQETAEVRGEATLVTDAPMDGDP